MNKACECVPSPGDEMQKSMRKIKVGDAVHAIMNKKVMIVSGIMSKNIVECVWLDENKNLSRRTFKSQSLYLIDDFRLKSEIQLLKSVLSRQNPQDPALS